MAFAYRNTLDSAISALPQRYSDQLLSTVGDQISKKLKNTQKLFSYRTNPEVQELLAEFGVELAPISYQAHSHPACKMIENHLLYVVLPNLFKNELSVGFISLREEKKDTFVKMRRFLKKGEFQAIKMFNSCIDAKDRFRYGPDCPEEDFNERLTRIRDDYHNGFQAPVMLMHDELHFHSEEEILDLFDALPRLKSLVCTLVCPTELLFGEESSRNPRIYGFEIRQDDLYFFPDGQCSEGYVQPLSSSLWPLRTGRLSRPAINLRVSVVSTIFAHHIVVISRSSARESSSRFFMKPTCLMTSELASLGLNNPRAQIERKTILSIMTYLSCLKGPNQESALAKFRQLEKRELFDSELELIATITETFSVFKKWDGMDLSYVQKAKRKFCSAAPWVASFFFEETVWKELFKSFSRNASSKWVEISTGSFDSHNFWKGPTRFKEVEFFHTTSYSTIKVIDPVVKLPRQVFIDRANVVSGPQPLLFIEYTMNAPTEDHGTRNGVAFCSAEMEDVDTSFLLKDDKRKNSCVFRSITSFMDLNVDELLSSLVNSDISEGLMDNILYDQPVSIDQIAEIASFIGRRIEAQVDGNLLSFGMGEPVYILLKDGHCTPIEKFYQGSSSNSKSMLPSLGSVVYPFSKERMDKLIKSMLRGSTGVLINDSEVCKDSVGSLKSINSDFLQEGVEIQYIWGAPGSGKTHRLMNVLNSGEAFRAAVVSPRRLLADDWKNKLTRSFSKVFTFESVFERDLSTFNCLILDELSLYPPGYLDLIVSYFLIGHLTFRNGVVREAGKGSLQRKAVSRMANTQILVIGDPMQSRYYSEQDEILLDRSFDIDRLTLAGANKTVWRTYRMESWFEKFFDIPTLVKSTLNDNVKVYSGVSAISSRKYDAILCASREDRRLLSCNIPIYTFGESQGLTFERTLIALTDKIHLVSDHNLFVAFTRSRKQFDFLMASERPYEDFVRCSNKKLLGYVLRQEMISRDRLSSLFYGVKPEFLSNAAFGVNIREKAALDLFIQPLCDLSDYEPPEAVDVIDVVPKPENQKCHLPIVSVNPILLQSSERIKERFYRESFKHDLGFSEQFDDLDLKGRILLNFGVPMKYESIFPRHQGSDSVTFLMGVKKRLRFSDMSTEMPDFHSKMEQGVSLSDFFFRMLPEKFEVISEDIEEANFEFNQKRNLKSAAMWENHSNRSDIDWNLDEIFLFMKSQLCTKSEKMYVDAKAGQTLACFQHIILFKLGPMLRAIEKAFLRACGDKYYIHSCKNFESLNDFLNQNSHMLLRGDSVESDYEAFDSSQDSLILAFEVACLKRLGVQSEFIQLYTKIKTRLRCRLGGLAVMRFTGEFCTFLFNTWSNMLFTFLKYEVKKDSRILFAGDDMASLGPLVKRKKDDPLAVRLSDFRLKAKEEVKKFPMFCGWILTPIGILKKPSLLLSRLMVMQEKFKIRESIDNYLLEMQYGYRMGENLFDYLDEFEIECHYKTVRFFLEHSHLCRGESIKVLKTFGYTFGNEDGLRTLVSSRSFDVLKIARGVDVVRSLTTQLGREDVKLKKNEPFSCSAKCQLLKSMISQSSSKVQSSRSDVSIPPICMGTQMCITQKCSTALDVLNPMSKLSQAWKKVSQFQNSQFWMKTRQVGLEGDPQNIASFISEQFSSISLHSFQILKNSKGKLPLLTRQFLNLRTGSLQLMTSTLKKGLHLSFLGLRIASLLLINICRTSLKYSFIFQKFLLWKGVKLWLSTLGYCTGFQTLRGLCRQGLAVLDGFTKKSKEFQRQMGLASQVMLLKSFNVSSTRSTRLLTLSQEVGFFQKELLVKSFTEPQVSQKDLMLRELERRKKRILKAHHLLKEVWGNLGLPRLELRIEATHSQVNMSYQEVQRTQVRNAVKRWVWDTLVDPDHNFFQWPENAELAGADLETYNRILEHVLPFLFGNIAIAGTSNKIVWPNIAIPIPAINLTLQDGGGEVNWQNGEINLREVCPAMDLMRRVSNLESIRSCTFRNLCEPFAGEAMEFLRTRRQMGVTTNIYNKWPRAFENAPWCAFDFAGGLNMSSLTGDERTVIDRMTKRLFRTEGQKYVFSAQGEVNMSLEG